MAKPKLTDYYTHDEMYAIQADLKCYAIPYGLVGFLSHLVIIYIYLRLTSQIPRVPLLLRKPISHTIYSRALVAIAMGCELALNAYSLAQCGFALEVGLVQVGKMLLILCWTGLIFVKLSLSPEDAGGAYAPASQDADGEVVPLSDRSRHSKEVGAPEIKETKSSLVGGFYGQVSAPYLSPEKPMAQVHAADPEANSHEVSAASTRASTAAVIGGLMLVVHTCVSLASVGMVVAGTVKMAIVSDDPKPGYVMGGFCAGLAFFVISGLVIVIISPCQRIERPDGTTGLTCGECLGYVGGRLLPLLMIAGPLAMVMADWVIAVLGNRLMGVPPADGPKGVVLRYWLYFGLSKLPLLAF